MWVRQWILRRPEHGLYEKLMVELRNEDPRAFQHFMRMPPAMFDELVQRLTPRLTKQDTNYRASLEPGLKVAITLRHLASAIKNIKNLSDLVSRRSVQLRSKNEL